MMTSTMLLMFFMITILLVSVLYYKNNLSQFKKAEENANEDGEQLTEQQIITTFSFQYIIDSKYIGLLVFLLSNVLTGVINLNMKTLYIENSLAFVILVVYNFVSYLIPFLFYYQYYFKD
jgi:phosphatidylinositol glycan class W